MSFLSKKTYETYLTKLDLSLQKLAPQRLLSRLAGWLAENQCPWLKNLLIRYFLYRFATLLNLAEAEESNPYAYPSFNALFTRRLQAASRPIDRNPHVLVSPCDGNIAELGYFKGQQYLEVKGQTSSLQALLGGPLWQGPTFENGAFLSIYLAPADYHRVHMPLDGILEHMLYIPGKLFSVGPRTVAVMPELFTLNERVVSLFDTAYGKVAVILVGAMLVGSISMVWSGVVNHEHGQQPLSYHYPHTAENRLLLRKGEDLGHFKMGSTVIVLLESERIVWPTELAISHKLQLGQSLGLLH
jgi:phosphatidylserine decarboxylase